MATEPPNTNKERTRGISLLATKVFFPEGVSPWLRLIDVIPISEPSIACFSAAVHTIVKRRVSIFGKKSRSKRTVIALTEAGRQRKGRTLVDPV